MAALLNKLTQHIDRLQSNHRAVTNRPWLELPSGRVYLLLVVLLSLAAAFINFQVRNQQLTHWESHPEKFFVGDTPLFSTMDAGYFLGIAQSLLRQETPNDFMARRSFPDGEKNAQKNADSTPGKAPLLSTLIFWLADNDSPQALLKTGNEVIPITAALTALAIILCFGATGYWLEGSVAAVGGGLSIAYLQRSSIGRIDTDQLNLGFFYLLFGLAIWAGRAKNWQVSLVVTIMAGLTARLFMSWYNKPELIWMSLFALFWMILICSRDWRRAIGFSILFILLSGLQIVEIGGSSYVKESFSTGLLKFPNVLTTVSEVVKIDLHDMLLQMTGSIWLGVIGLSGMVFWAIRHPIYAIALGPLAVFAMLNFVIGNRAIFYSAPAIWFGLAFILITICRACYQMVLARAGSRPDVQQAGNLAVTGVIASILLIASYFVSPHKFVPQAAVPPKIISALESLNNITSGEGAVMATWWDYGYSSLLFNRLPVLADGGTQLAAPTFMMAKALLAPTQRETAAILKFLAREGDDGIQAHASSQESLFRYINDSATQPAPTIYFMLTNQMSDWIYSISQIGNWDLDTGTAIPVRGNANGSALSYDMLKCKPMAAPSQMRCNGHVFDLSLGKVDGQPVLDGAVRTRQGRQIGGVAFPGNQLNVIQIAETDKSKRIYLLHRNLFQSSYNQLFHLGRANSALFEIVYDDYPHARIFRLQTK
ncbi:MAG: hypothetical protein VX106_04475 [Pseudomonadota bacterium]|nr:hypothetical protein [Pseudomonadota bacterium]